MNCKEEVKYHSSLLQTLLLILVIISRCEATLDPNYYHKTCPQAENIVRSVVQNAIASDPKVPARLLRMFFHDCFVRGCDASVLLDSTQENKAEKDGPPNISLGAFHVIDDAKSKLEASCPQTVSCADVLAIAARDAVLLTGGPSWTVLKGRKDGTISKASDTVLLPAPSSNSSHLIQAFSQRRLSPTDLVALSGGHTLGFSHCSSFQARLRNFTALDDVDPTLDPTFAADLKSRCPNPNSDPNAGQFLDSTAAIFDNDYYRRIIAGEGVFVSDQSLYVDYRTRWIVEALAGDQGLFFGEFAAAMVRLGNVGVKEKAEVRVNCRAVN